MISNWGWDEYFINEAYTAARKSKDESTQVGACIAGPDNDVRAKGYNGAVRGEDDNDPRMQAATMKEHAERNAFYHCARFGIPCNGCKLYSTWPLCIDCARAAKQCGIVEVVYHFEAPVSPKWIQSFASGVWLLRRTGVKVRYWSGQPDVSGIRFSGTVHRFRCDDLPTVEAIKP